MDREQLLTQLVRLRELQLNQDSRELKSQSGALAQIDRERMQAQSAAAETIESGHNLRDLSTLGSVRLGRGKLRVKIQDQVRELGKRVGRARKLAESARQARAEIKDARAAANERSLENEAEHFFSWKGESKTRR